MRILVWSQYFWPESFCINEIVQQLCQKGIHVTVLTGKPNYPDGIIFPGYKAWGVHHETYSGAEVFRLPLIPRRKGTAFNLILNYTSFIVMGYIFAPFILRKKKYDVVFVYGTSPFFQALPAIFMAWLKNAKLSIWLQDLWPESLEATGFVKNKLFLEGVRGIVKYIYRHTDSILIQSESFRSPIEPFVSQNCSIIHLANPTHDFRERTTCSVKAVEISQDVRKHFSLIFAGNIGRAQSVETIVFAADLLRSYPEIKFYLIGGGSQVKEISELISGKQLKNVAMFERLPYAEISTIFAASSGLIVSLKNNDALSKTIPSKIQSYFSAGKPIIGCLNGEGQKIITHSKAGFVCPAEDSVSLAERIKQLYTLTQEERDILSNNGRNYYERYCSLEIISQNLVEHLQNQ
jgi:glycosyltransferase involved in cell wall biosynthesis